jgi:phage shock protein PspC (stress-responsive transcriptional regulator)
LSFAGPLVMATMMVLFAKGSKSNPMPWVVSGVAALICFELGLPPYLILLLSVLAGVVGTLFGLKRNNV